MDTNLLYQQIKDLKLVENLECSALEKEILRYLIKQVIFTNPIHQCKIVGNKTLWKFIPKNKSLFHSAKNYGLPIGNYTSQIFGNIYLNELDHWVKNEIRKNTLKRYISVKNMLNNYETKEKIIV